MKNDKLIVKYIYIVAVELTLSTLTLLSALILALDLDLAFILGLPVVAAVFFFALLFSV